jgi:ribosomal protein S13
MYDRQRADALQDWDKQNKYNSPSQQMQRYKEAGLNPNLIYGQMSNSAAIRSTDMKQPDFVAPKLQNTGQVMNNYIDLKLKEQQLSNDKQAGELLREQTKGKSLENQNVIDQTPYIAEERFQRSRLTGKQVDSIMEDISNKQQMNPLLRDKVTNDIKTMTQNRMYQNLTTPQQIAFQKATTKLIEAKIAGQDIENAFRKYTNSLQTNLGINSNLISDILKIGLGSLLNRK